jgi:hypothetical protein
MSNCSHSPATTIPELGRSGITIESSFTVKHDESDHFSKGDTDEASLVSHGSKKEP